MQIKDPIRVSIEAKKRNDGKWHLWYQEFFEFEDGDIDEAAKTTVDFMKRVSGVLTKSEFNVSYDPKNKCLEVTMEGDKDSVFSALAGEFLSQSHLGQMTLREVLFSTLFISLSLQPKIEEDKYV